MTPEETAEHVSPGIGAFGPRWMLSQRTMAAGAAMGYGPFEQYFCARGGVLGNAPASVVYAVFGFFDESLVVEQWNAGCAKGPLEPLIESYETCCANTARHFGAETDWARLGDLAERVVRAAPTEGNPLFAGWRDRALRPAAGELPRRGGLLLNALRELRGGVHLMALRTYGVDLLHSVLITGGEPNAGLFGFTAPYPEYAASRPAWEMAEAATNAMVAVAYEALEPAERVEFAELVDQFVASFQ